MVPLDQPEAALVSYLRGGPPKNLCTDLCGLAGHAYAMDRGCSPGIMLSKSFVLRFRSSRSDKLLEEISCIVIYGESIGYLDNLLELLGQPLGC